MEMAPVLIAQAPFLRRHSDQVAVSLPLAGALNYAEQCTGEFDMKCWQITSFITATAILGSPVIAQGPPDGSSAREKAIIKADPLFDPRPLVLRRIPKAIGRSTKLFNGRDLEGWDTWLGLPNAADTYAGAHGDPIGLNHDEHRVFSVVAEDGAPAILANGKVFGGLISKGDYRNYHLHVEFKWGGNTWIDHFPRNNGILYHSQGPYGAFFKSWMSAVEFEIVPHSVGMILTVGASRSPMSFQNVDWRVGARTTVGRDNNIPYPFRRFMPGGRLVPVTAPAFNVEAAVDAEKPIGEWNSLDLYVVGSRSVHVVNGRPVMVAQDLTITDRPGGAKRPLSHGRIQLQSEGAETYFRNVVIEPIARLPRVVPQR